MVCGTSNRAWASGTWGLGAGAGASHISARRQGSWRLSTASIRAAGRPQERLWQQAFLGREGAQIVFNARYLSPPVSPCSCVTDPAFFLRGVVGLSALPGDPEQVGAAFVHPGSGVISQSKTSSGFHPPPGPGLLGRGQGPPAFPSAPTASQQAWGLSRVRVRSGPQPDWVRVPAERGSGEVKLGFTRLVHCP